MFEGYYFGTKQLKLDVHMVKVGELKELLPVWHNGDTQGIFNGVPVLVAMGGLM